jgi:hypothetical protein
MLSFLLSPDVGEENSSFVENLSASNLQLTAVVAGTFGHCCVCTGFGGGGGGGGTGLLCGRAKIERRTLSFSCPLTLVNDNGTENGTCCDFVTGPSENRTPFRWCMVCLLHLRLLSMDGAPSQDLME